MLGTEWYGIRKVPIYCAMGTGRLIDEFGGSKKDFSERSELSVEWWIWVCHVEKGILGKEPTWTKAKRQERVWWDLEVVTHPIRLEQSLWGGEWKDMEPESGWGQTVHPWVHLEAEGSPWKEHCFGIKQPIICFLWQRASGIHVPLYHGRYYREAAGPRGCS